MDDVAADLDAVISADGAWLGFGLETKTNKIRKIIINNCNVLVIHGINYLHVCLKDLPVEGTLQTREYKYQAGNTEQPIVLIQKLV